MAFQPVENVLQVVFDMQKTEAVRIQNTMYFHNASGWNATLAENVATAAGDAWGTELMPNLHVDMNMWRIRWKDLGAEFGVEGNKAYNVQGGDVGLALTLALAVGITFRAAQGPPKQGRLFISGQDEDVIDGEFWVSTRAVAIREAVEAVAQAAEGTFLGTEHHIVSRYQKNPSGPGSVPRNPAVSARVTSYQHHLPIWTQRDRRPGEGT